MKRFTFGACALALAVLATGCGGDTIESLMKEEAGVYNEMASTLDGIKAKDDVAKAKPNLEAAGKKLEGIKERAKKLGNPSLDDLKKLAEGMKPVMEAQMKLAKAQTEAAARVGGEALQGLVPNLGGFPGFPGGGFPGGGLPGLPGGKIEFPGGGFPGGKIEVGPGGAKIEVPGGPKIEVPGFPPPPQP